jgi:hypothetical protein
MPDLRFKARLSRRRLYAAAGSCVLALGIGRTALAQESTESLATAAQNPVAAMYSLPFQNSTYFGAGPSHDKSANVLNIQPVLPFSFGEWNIISRTIAPLIYVPSVKTGFDASLGEDTTEANVGPRALPQAFRAWRHQPDLLFIASRGEPLHLGGGSINQPADGDV